MRPAPLARSRSATSAATSASCGRPTRRRSPRPTTRRRSPSWSGSARPSPTSGSSARSSAPREASRDAGSSTPSTGRRTSSGGFPYWATLLALEEDGEVTLGVVHSPATGELFWARRGQGAWADGVPLRVSPVDRLGDAMLVHSSLNLLRPLDGGRCWDGFVRLVERDGPPARLRRLLRLHVRPARPGGAHARGGREGLGHRALQGPLRGGRRAVHGLRRAADDLLRHARSPRTGVFTTRRSRS